MNKLIYVLSFLVIFGCTKGADTPEALIKTFVKDVATKKIDREYYQKYTTDKFLAVVEDQSDEELEKNSRMSGVKEVKVKILSKNCDGPKCIVTYTVSYTTETKEDSNFKSVVKKIAEVVKVDDYWKLSNLRNLKTFHESNKAIDVSNDGPTENP
jgi:uncharacterized membrane protein